jgi:hypothetical protein
VKYLIEKGNREQVTGNWVIFLVFLFILRLSTNNFGLLYLPVRKPDLGIAMHGL